MGWDCLIPMITMSIDRHCCHGISHCCHTSSLIRHPTIPSAYGILCTSCCIVILLLLHVALQNILSTSILTRLSRHQYYIHSNHTIIIIIGSCLAFGQLSTPYSQSKDASHELVSVTTWCDTASLDICHWQFAIHPDGIKVLIILYIPDGLSIARPHFFFKAPLQKAWVAISLQTCSTNYESRGHKLASNLSRPLKGPWITSPEAFLSNHRVYIYSPLEIYM